MSRISRRFVVCSVLTLPGAAALVLAAAAPKPVAASGPDGIESPRPSAVSEFHRPRGVTRAQISTIAFVSTRDDPPGTPNPQLTGEIYLMNADGTNLRRLTENTDREIGRASCRERVYSGV